MRYSETRVNFSGFGKTRFRKVHFWLEVASEGSSALLSEKDGPEEASKLDLGAPSTVPSDSVLEARLVSFRLGSARMGRFRLGYSAVPPVNTS